MTVDLATLSLKVDSSQVTQSAMELDKLASSGKRAETSSQGLAREWVKASSTAGKLRMDEAALRMEIERQIESNKRAAMQAEARRIVEERLGNTVVKSTGAQKAGMQQLSYQLGDVSTMFALGARPMQIFASQGSQVVQALQLMTGSSKGFLAFLGGPWGLAITSAVTVLGTLGAAYLSAGDDADEATTKLEQALDRFRQGLRQTDDVSAVMTEATRELIPLTIELTAAQNRLNSMVGENALNKAARDAAQERVDSIQAEIDGIRNLVSETVSQAALRDRLDREAVQRNEERRDSERSARDATRARTRGLSEQERETQRLTRATDSFIDSLEDEFARLTMSDEAYRQREIAMARATAQTDEQRAAIDKLAESLEIVNGKLEAQRELDAINDKQKADIEERADLAEKLAEDARKKEEQSIREMANLYETLFTGGVDDVWTVFKKQGIAAISTIAAQWTLALLSGQSTSFDTIAGGVLGSNPLGALFGSLGGGPANDNGTFTTTASGGAIKTGIGGVFGGGILPSDTGGAGGIGANPLGEVGGQMMLAAGISSITSSIVGGNSKASKIGSQIGGQAGMAVAGPIGAIVGSILGGAVGSLFSGSQKGGVTINGGDILSTFGKAKYQGSGTQAAGSIFDSLANIADALGATLNTSAGSLSFGERKGNIRVDPFGLGNTKTGKGAIDFGQDTEAAIAFAIRDLITDGVLEGISQASLNILKAGGDLEKAIEKAALIESVPRLLKERLDPLGAALDEIDDQFQYLVDALREGGATAQQFADAERLYNLEREAAIEQFGQGALELKNFLDSLNFGSNSPLSVRSQLSSARDNFAQYETAILNGEAVDQAAFTSAAQTLLGLSRQASGSSGAFFSDFDTIRNLTEMAIVNSGSSAVQDGTVVFTQQTATNTQNIAQMQEDTNNLLREILNQLAAGTVSATSNPYGYFTDQRSFA